MSAKSKLNDIEVLIFKALIDSNISHDEFVLINNKLKDFMIWKKKLKILIIIMVIILIVIIIIMIIIVIIIINVQTIYIKTNVILLFEV